MTPARAVVLCSAILVFALPELARAMSAPVSYAAVTALFTLIVIAFVMTAAQPCARPPAAARPRRAAAAAVGVAAAAVVVAAAFRWTHLAAWLPYHADMLIVIREATRRVLRGRNPYTIYRAFDAPWDMAMPYGPALWGPFVAAQLLRLDFRLLTIVGELLVPVWCGIAAALETARGRTASAASWLAVLAVLVIALDVQRYTLIGHTPIYWPLFLLLAATMARRRWVAAACVLGLLVVARTTMVAIVPLFLAGVWTSNKDRFPAALAALTLTIAVALAPFVASDYRAVWDSMVLSYPRVMRSAVWPVLARPGLETIGVTESLIERHHESLVVPAQIAAMLAAYTGGWIAIRRDRPALPWMALALCAFSMTTLYPVHYLYYDVLLLLVADALAPAVAGTPARRIATPWTLSLVATAALMVIVTRSVALPFPHVVPGRVSRDGELRSGFAPIEHDGQRAFAWVVGHEARIVLPRSSADAADIILTARSPFTVDQPPQQMVAVLNGTVVADVAIPAGPREIRMSAARSTWWIGFNELRLVFSATAIPRESGGGDDRRPLALSVSGVDVVSHAK